MFFSIGRDKLIMMVYREYDTMMVVMNMTINDLLKEKGMSRYSLSKSSDIPWATLSDICSGKTSLIRCNAQTIQKLSSALDMTIEEVLALTAENSVQFDNVKPSDRPYLEKNISVHLQKAFDNFIRRENVMVPYMDCLLVDLYVSINAVFCPGVVLEE